MKVLDIGSGKESARKPCNDLDFWYKSLDINPDFSPDICIDFLDFTFEQLMKLQPDVIWASPMCTTWSIAGISHHRKKTEFSLESVSDAAKTADKFMIHLFELLDLYSKGWWFIENPRGGLRKMDFMQPYNNYRHTVTYCQYGDERMKPTDIWTNNPNWKPRPMCKNGDPCHEAAPRGSKTGTQGRKGIDRSAVPYLLLREILESCQ
jgi:hypothetical protein